MSGGVEDMKFSVGMRVQRVKGDDDIHADGSIHPGEAIGKPASIISTCISSKS